MRVVILMYHRICPKSLDTACYFERGTAITPQAFASQMNWLHRHFEVIALNELHDLFAKKPPHKKPFVILSFDDGYQDVFQYALPVCRTLGFRGVAFVSSGTGSTREFWLWFDRFYALAHGLLKRSIEDISRLLSEINQEAGIHEPPPTTKHDFLSQWTRGPLKEHFKNIHASDRIKHLSRWEKLVDMDCEKEQLYMGDHEKIQLTQAGWEIGGHGLTHSLLPRLSEEDIKKEIEASSLLCSTFQPAGDWSFSYPDGAWSEEIWRHAQHLGFRRAVTVSSGEICLEKIHWGALPRLFCRGEQECPHPSLFPMVCSEPSEQRVGGL